MKVLVTGAAGFIGMHVAQRLLDRGDKVVGLDNLNEYYDVNLKLARLAELRKHREFEFHKIDIVDANSLERLMADEGFDSIVHLAAQAGVRYSLTNPHAYIQSNITGFLNVLEACRKYPVQAFGLCEQLERLWRQHETAVQRIGQRRPSGQPVRGDEEVERVDGAQLQPSLRHPDDWFAVLYRLRPVGPTRHGLVYFHARDFGRRTDRRFQSWRHAARLHLYRRRRRRRH